MSWNPITADDVLSEFNPKEQSKISEIQGAPDNLTNIVNRVIGMARGCIAAGGNELGPEGTVPDQVAGDVIAIARWRWIITLPKVSEALQSDARDKAQQAAQKHLDAIANGHPKVEVPAAPIASTGTLIQMPAIKRRPRQFRRGFEDGI